jgi:hypothetical protein
VNLANLRELDELVAAVESARLVVVDCRAASTDVFLNYFAELTVFDVLNSMGAALTVVSPVNHDLDSVEQIRIIAKAFNNRCRYLVVKNHGLHGALHDLRRQQDAETIVERTGCQGNDHAQTPRLVGCVAASGKSPCRPGDSAPEILPHGPPAAQELAAAVSRTNQHRPSDRLAG